MLARLSILDLSHGDVTDAGARLLAEHARRLEGLDLTDNALTPAGIRALRRARIAVTAANQHEPGDDRYLYVGEFE
jgi:Leucine Rich repeat